MLTSRRSLVLASLLVASGAASWACSEAVSEGETSPSDLIVSQDLVLAPLYGGGGNTGAPIKNDFVEISNRGQSPVSLAGKSLQYTGYGKPLAAAENVVDLPNVMLAP